MSADNDAATKSPSKGFSLRTRFLGRGSAKDAPKDDKSEEAAKADAAPGPGSSLLASMLGDDEGEASVTITKAAADEPSSETAPEPTAVDEPAPAPEPEPEPAPEAKLPAPPKTFSFRSKFLGLGGPAKTSLPKPAAPEPPEDDTPPEAAPDVDPAKAMSAIKAALADDVKDEPKPEVRKVEIKASEEKTPAERATDAVFAEGDAQPVEVENPIVTEPAGPVPFVRFHNVRKTYDGVSLVVKDLNLDIQKGEFLTLLGPSGSGKTTTLMMLAGFETPTEGDILVDGKSLADTPPHHRGLGFVFQNYALFPHMTVGENLAFPLEVRRKSKNEIRQRVQRALQMVELEGFDKRKPNQLSGGQQQRVAVARALVFDPSLVLMDEPLGALDKHLREQMQYELKRLHRELGVTVVYVTHDQGEALTLSDRIAVFHDGVIQQLDTPSKIYEAPANAFVASFIGENNALAGRVLSIEDNLCTVELSGGTRVKAVRGNCGVPGTTVVVCVRPENLTLSEEAGPAPRGGENHLAAMVDDMVFHGDHVRVKLSSTGGHEIDVKTRGTGIPAKGVTVTLSWEPYACRAFAAS